MQSETSPASHYPAPPGESFARATGFWAWLARWNDQVGKRPGLAGGVLFALTALVFQGVLGGAFNFDDIPLILENPYVTKPGHWRLLFFRLHLVFSRPH